MKKLDKLIPLLILAALGYAAYVYYQNKKATQSDKAIARFNQALEIWMRKIERAHKEMVPGWERWYIAPGPFRDAALGRVREAALWQILQNQPELIPPGYQIIDNGNQLAFLQKF